MDNLVTGSIDNIAHIRESNFTFVHYDVTNYIYVDGPLDMVGSYTVGNSGTLLDSVTHVDATVPGPGAGLYYLFGIDCPGRSWQTVLGDQPDRDLTLP